ncbi:hypothetical protein EDC04DRAFT_2604215 [Pisolithus marmoratus]|nr:hypothetical protein EDC04DRAFT_2604215 [Pisolithus marmoratus]
MTQVSSQGDISQPDDTSKTGFDCCVDHQRQCMSNTDIRMDASMNSMEGNNDEMWFLDDDYVVEDEEQLVDEGEHDIPQQLVTADAHTQREVHLGLYEQQPASGRDHVTKFKASGVKGMWMSTLQLMHDNKRAMAAVGLLRQQHWITMDDTQMRVLPFNPEGQMMVLGMCMDKQLWLAMAPNMYFKEGYGENREEVIPVLESKTMVLSTEHWYMMIMFIAHVLDSMRHEDIHCIVEYPELLTLESIKASMEVLGRFEERHRNIKLSLNDMKAFHRHFINSWAEWVRKAPASWKQDGFLVENMPVGVCLQYGQNQPIMISFSLTTHISYLDVQRWHNMSLERITQNHGEVYDKPDHDLSRVAVDLRELDLLDEDGYEINMYNKAGWRVPRRVPKESELCGALLDLDKVHELFQGRDEVHGEMTNEVEFWVYPLPFTWKYGNVKAHGIIPNMAACIGKLNELIFRGGMEDDDMDIDEGGEDRIYNSLLHWVRNEAKFHLVQLGMITSAFAGAGIETAGGQHWWEKQMEFCNGGLPHERYSQKVTGDGQPQDLRFENTYTVELTRIREELQNGRSIYKEIICPLLKAWSHPQVLGCIKDSLKLFKADIIPELFKCATYPVTALIEMIWAKHKQDLQDKRNIDACTVEVMSMLEQMLNFAHMGNAAVLSTRLMDQAWLLLGLLSDGFPALLDTFIAHGALSMGKVMVRWHEWPVEAETRWPMTSSKWAQQLTYGKAHYEAYKAKFTIKLAVENLLPNAYSHISNASFRQACYAADVAFRVYFDDVKKLAILAPNKRKFKLMTSMLGKKLTSFIADIVIKQCSKVMAHNIPPFIKGGNFIHVARVAVEEMKNAGTHAGHSGGDLTGFVADVICAACEHLKINHVPWSRNPTGGAGWPSNVVVHDMWLNLGGQAPLAMGSRSMNVPAQQSNSAMAYQASQVIQAGDTHGEWSAMDVRLTSFDMVLHKINLPSDWALAHIEVEGMPEYILDGYRFMQNMYDEAKPLHQLNIWRSWTGWNETGRGTRSMVDSSRWCQDLSSASAKGINTFLLVCLGLASIKMASGFWSAKWMVDIKPCGGDKIIMRHAEVVQLMKSGGTYGGFDVVRYLAGMKAANILQMNQFVTVRALPGTAQASPSSKRSREEWDEGHDDDGILPCGSHGTQWKVSCHD